jgi:hypothetical protein
MNSMTHGSEPSNGEGWPTGYDDECDGHVWETGPDPDDLQWWAEHAPSSAEGFDVVEPASNHNPAPLRHGLPAGLAMSAGWPDTDEAERIRLGILG